MDPDGVRPEWAPYPPLLKQKLASSHHFGGKFMPRLPTSDPMSTFPKISSLFAALGANLRSQDPMARNEVDASISDLNSSLNLCEVPRARVLDEAVSLMCFTAPQVYDSTVEFTVKTIVTVLSSSIACEVLTINKERVLRVGGTISKNDCAVVLEACADILKKLGGHKGDLCNSLLYAAIRMAALAPCFWGITSSSSNFVLKFSDSRTSVVPNLLGHLPDEFKFSNGEIPLRLLIWHLDPMILKQDISQILQEIITRPFLSFSMEVYDRIEWRSKLLCLVVSPLMFVETRALLHNWFLMTGLASVMELLIDFAQQVLDVISRPMWWGLSMEIGSKLPFSQAYFPHEHHLLRILVGPICHEYFQLLLNNINGSESHAGGHSRTFSNEAATKFNAVDHKSMWALVINFPDWFYFATMLLFCNGSPPRGFHSGSVALSARSCLIHDVEVSWYTAAAKFIAWFLNPVDVSNQYLMVDCLVKASELWILKCSSSVKHDEARKPDGKEATRFRLHNKDETRSHEGNFLRIWSWLREFKSTYTKLFGMRVGFSTSKIKEPSINQTLLLRRIPLGILLGHPNNLDEVGFSLVLHYAATGTIQKSSDKPNVGQNQKGWTPDLDGDSEILIEQYTESEAIAGCKTVFDITDVAESISPIFETEEDALNFMFQLKLKACNYLLKCVKRLLRIKLHGDGIQMQRDLLARLLRWRHQVKDGFPNNKDLDFICNALNA